MKPLNPQLGDVGFSYSAGWIQRVICAITISKWSHCFVIGEAFGKLAVLEAGDWSCQVVDYAKNYQNCAGTKFRVWRPNAVTDDAKKLALLMVYDDLSGTRYGWLQMPWFIWNLFCMLIFRRKSPFKNPFPGGTICSELTWHYLFNLGGPYAAMVQQFDSNSVSAQDLENLILNNIKLFDLVTEVEVPA